MSMGSSRSGLEAEEEEGGGGEGEGEDEDEDEKEMKILVTLRRAGLWDAVEITSE